MVLKPTGASQTPKTTDFQPNSNPSLQSPPLATAERKVSELTASSPSRVATRDAEALKQWEHIKTIFELITGSDMPLVAGAAAPLTLQSSGLGHFGVTVFVVRHKCMVTSPQLMGTSPGASKTMV